MSDASSWYWLSPYRLSPSRGTSRKKVFNLLNVFGLWAGRGWVSQQTFWIGLICNLAAEVCHCSMCIQVPIVSVWSVDVYCLKPKALRPSASRTSKKQTEHAFSYTYEQGKFCALELINIFVWANWRNFPSKIVIRTKGLRIALERPKWEVLSLSCLPLSRALVAVVYS